MKKFFKVTGYVLLALVVLTGAYMATNWPFWSNVITLSMNFSTATIDETIYEPKQTVTGGNGAPISKAATSNLSSATINELNQFMIEQKSAALLVYQNGEMHFETYGEGLTVDTRTESASMAKSVLALMVGAAIEDGYINSVDDPIGDYYAPWAGKPHGDVAIKNYLTMSAGLRIHPMFGPPSSPLFQIYMGDDIEEQMAKVDLEFTPGTEFQYNGLESQALLLALEAASGKSYADYLSEKVWRPIGAKDAAVWLDREGGNPRGFCCLFATARDWLRVGRLHLNAGNVDGQQILSAQWMRAVITPSSQNPNYGYQTWLGSTHEPERQYNQNIAAKVPHAEPFAVEDMIYFDGAGGQRVYIVPSMDLVIVHTGPIDFNWEESYLPNLIINDLKS